MGGTVGIILAIGAAGLGAVLLGRDAGMLMACNQALVIAVTLLLVAFTVAPGLARVFLVTRSPVAVGGTLVLAAAVLHSNLKGIFGLEYIPFLEPLAFAAFVASMGYVAAELVFADGIRLVSLEKELEVARRIQASILPEAPPASDRIRIAAACLPMTQVGGDFYVCTKFNFQPEGTPRTERQRGAAMRTRPMLPSASRCPALPCPSCGKGVERNFRSGFPSRWPPFPRPLARRIR